MHIYFTRNRGEIMKQNKKIAITHYISIRFSAIIFIMAIIMILFISYFSNKTIYFDIRRQIRKEHAMIFSILMYGMEKYL